MQKWPGRQDLIFIFYFLFFTIQNIDYEVGISDFVWPGLFIDIFIKLENTKNDSKQLGRAVFGS